VLQQAPCREKDPTPTLPEDGEGERHPSLRTHRPRLCTHLLKSDCGTIIRVFRFPRYPFGDYS